MSNDPMVTLVTFPDGHTFELPLSQVKSADAPTLRAAVISAVNEYNLTAAVPLDLAGALTAATAVMEAAGQVEVSPEASVEATPEDLQTAVDANIQAKLADPDDAADGDKVPLADFAPASDFEKRPAASTDNTESGPIPENTKDPVKTGYEHTGEGGPLMPEPGTPLVPTTETAPQTTADPAAALCISTGELVEAISRHSKFGDHAKVFAALGFRGDARRMVEMSVNVLDCMGVELAGNDPQAVGRVRDAIAKALGLI